MVDPKTVAQSPPVGGSGGLEEGPSQVGPFRILGVLGEGGMGTVYLAEQTEPVRRQVALKVLRREKQSDRRLARFEAEQQALALMNHPGIATVYYSGTTENGLPFFAMEVVEGLPIVEYCDRQRLSLQERLKLFCEVCDAVQHAHQKMVIHRDLKPSNVLVTVGDGGVVPKLIDFGIAKGLVTPLVDSAKLTTREGLPIGTPMYMSPEQIEGDALDLDARTDVYSLGVMLYELIAGVLPFDTDGVEAVQAMLLVLKGDAPRPSARFKALPLGEQRRIASDRGGVEARELGRRLRSDLDWITMRAIEKNRERRYGSAAELKSELVRFLANRPVRAAQLDATYALRKFIRRHRAGVAASMVALAVLLCGVTVSSISWLRAARARDAAVASELKARQTVEYLRKVLASVDPGVDGRQVKVVDLLSKASEMIASDLSNQPEVEAAIRKTIGLTLLELGVFEGAAPELEKTIAIQRAVLGDEHPETLHSVNGLARLLYKLGRYGDAASIHREVLEKQQRILGREDSATLWTMYNLAKALEKQGEWQEAETLYRENIAIRRRVLGPRHMDTLVSRNSMSVFLGRIGKLDEALCTQSDSLRTLEEVAGPQHPDTLRARANLLEIMNKQGRFDEVQEQSGEITGTLAEVLGAEHPETLGASAQLAIALHSLGRYKDAEAINRRVVAMRRAQLGEDHPDTLESELNLGLDQMRIGQEILAQRNIDHALISAREVFASGCWRTAQMEADYGRELMELGRMDEARPWLEAAYDALPAMAPAHSVKLLGLLIALHDTMGDSAAAGRLRRELERLHLDSLSDSAQVPPP